MNLRGKLVSASALLALLGIGAALLATERYLAAAARTSLTDEVTQGSQVYAALGLERLARRQAETRVVAEEPRLKAVVRTEDIDRATLEDVSDELRLAVRAELFALVDRIGKVAADVSVVKLEDDISGRPGVAAAARAGEGTGLWAVEGGLYEVVVRALRFGGEIDALLVTGYRLGDEAARAARRQTGCEAALLLDGAVVGSDFGGKLEGERAAAVASAPPGSSELRVGAERFVALRMPVPGASGPGQDIVLARSLDAALAAHESVRRSLALFGAGALLLAVLGGVALARSLTRRLLGVSAATRAFARGELGVRVPISGTDEISELADSFNTMASELESSREGLARKERLEREMQIAQRIQTALLPTRTVVPGFDVATRMIPAEQVGGDLFEVLTVEDGTFWTCIGDVTSHGLTPGLIMMMAQSALTALVRHDPSAGPRELLTTLNRVVYRNLQERLKTDEHMTMTLLKQENGRFTFSGAHLDLLIRRTTGKIERIPTPGVWVGVVPEVGHLLEENTLELSPGEVLLLYTDGLTEARSADGKQFETEAVETLLAAATGTAEELVESLVAAVTRHMTVQVDDISLVAIKRNG